MAAEDQILAQLIKMNASFDKMIRSGSSLHGQTTQRNINSITGHGSRDEKEARAAIKKTGSALDKAAKSLLEASKGIASGSDDAVKALNNFVSGLKSIDDEAAYVHHAMRSYGHGIGAMIEGSKEAVDSMTRFTTTLAKNTKQSSLLYAEQIKQLDGQLHDNDAQHRSYLSTLAKVADSLDDETKKSYHLIDEATGKLRKNLQATDYGHLVSSLGELQANAAELLSKSGLGSLESLIKNGEAGLKGGVGKKGTQDAAKELLVSMAAMLHGGGAFNPGKEHQHLLDGNGKLDASKIKALNNPKDLIELAKALQQANSKLHGFNAGVGKTIGTYTNTAGRYAASMGEQMKSWKAQAVTYMMSTAAFKKAYSNAKETFSTALDFNIAQVPQTFIGASISATRLGESLQEYTKLVGDNKRLFAVNGSDGFGKTMANFKDTFQKYGYSFKQGAASIGPTIDAAVNSGINIRSGPALQKYSQNLMASYQSMAGIISESLEEYAKLNAELLDASGIWETLTGLSKDQREQYAKSLHQERERYVLDGLSLRQAQKLVEMQKEQTRSPVEQRFQDSANAAALFQSMGMGMEAQRVMQLGTKGIRSKEEDIELGQLMAKQQQMMEAQRQSAYGPSGSGAGGYGIDVMMQNLNTGSLQKIGQEFVKMNMAKDAGATNTSEEQSKLAKAARGNEAVAVAENAKNNISAFMENTFIKTVGSSALALGALTIQTLGAASAMGLLKSGGVLGKLAGLSGLGGAAGAASTAAGGAAAVGGAGLLAKTLGVGGKLLKGGGIAGVIGAAGSIGGDYLKSTGHDTAGAWANIAGNTASMATMGATIGSFFGPGIGTAIGAGIGGVGGAAYGLWNNRDTIFGSPAADKNQSLTNPTSTDGSTDQQLNNSSTSSSSGPDKLSTAIDILSTIASGLSTLNDTQSKALDQLVSGNSVTGPSSARQTAMPASVFMTGKYA